MRLRSVFSIIALVGMAQMAQAQPASGPPAGEERAKIIALIRADHPAMPDALVAQLADVRRKVDEDAPCAVIDWLRAHADYGGNKPSPGPDELATCVLPSGDLDAARVAARLGDETFAFDVEGEVLTLFARSQEDEVRVCCSLQADMSRIVGTDLWAARRRIEGADAAMLSLTSELGSFDAFKTWRGPSAPPKPVETELGKWSGQVIEREMPSTSLGETRLLSIYLPPGYAKDRVWPALFLADGGAVEFGGLVEKMIEAGEIAPIVIISAESGEQGVVGEAPTQYGGDLRSAEYLRRFPGGGDRFDRHMEFFAKELVDYAIAAFNVSARREDRAVAGKSNGGVLALWAGVLHPEAFATAIPMSPGFVMMRAEDLADGERAVFRLSAGRYEADFIAAAKRTEALLKAAGYDAAGDYYAAGHFHDMWAVALRKALLEAFPPK